MKNPFRSNSTPGGAPPGESVNWKALAKECGEADASNSLPIASQIMPAPFEAEARTEHQVKVNANHRYWAPKVDAARQEQESTGKALEDHKSHVLATDQDKDNRIQLEKEAKIAEEAEPLKKEVEQIRDELHGDTKEAEGLEKETNGLHADGARKGKPSRKVWVYIIIALTGLMDTWVTFKSLVILRWNGIECLTLAILIGGAMGFMSHFVGKSFAYWKSGKLEPLRKLFMWISLATLMVAVYFIADTRHAWLMYKRPDLEVSFTFMLFINFIFVAIGILGAYLFYSKRPDETKDLGRVSKTLKAIKATIKAKRQKIRGLETEIKKRLAQIEKEFADKRVAPSEELVRLTETHAKAKSNLARLLAEAHAVEEDINRQFLGFCGTYRTSNIARRVDDVTPICFTEPVKPLKLYFSEPATNSNHQSKTSKTNYMETLKKTPQRASSKGSPNNTGSSKPHKAKIFSNTMILLMMFMSSFAIAQDQCNLLVMVDISGSSHGQFTPPSTDYLLDQIGVDLEEGGENSGTLTVTTMGTNSYCPDVRLSLPKGESSWWSNELDRVDEIKAFAGKAKNALNDAFSKQEGTEYSRLYQSMVRYLNELSVKGGKKQAYIYSDLGHNCGATTPHLEDFYEMVSDQNQWDKLTGLLEKSGSLKSLSGVQIILVYQSPPGDRDADVLYGYTRAYFTHLYETKGARVTYRPNIH